MEVVSRNCSKFFAHDRYDGDSAVYSIEIREDTTPLIDFLVAQGAVTTPEAPEKLDELKKVTLDELLFPGAL